MRTAAIVILATLPLLSDSRVAQACHDDTDPTNDTYTIWEGDQVQDLALSTAGDAPLVVARVVGDGDRLLAIPPGNPDAARELSIRASSFWLGSSPTEHLLATELGVQEDVRGALLGPDGRELGEPFTIFPASSDDRWVRTVVFDGQDFVVVVTTGGVVDEVAWLVRVSPDGTVQGPARLVDVADDAVFLPGPAVGQLWIVENQDETDWHVTARVRSADGTFGAPIDLGAGRVRGTAVSPTGALLVLHHPDGSVDGAFASILTPAGPIGPAVSLAADGWWLLAPRAAGGWIAVSTESGGIDVLVLDESGAPVGPSATWAAQGDNVRVIGGTLAWADRIEDGDIAHSHVSAVAFDATGAPGATTVLLETEQQRVEHPCSHACESSVAGRGGRADGLAIVLVLGVVAIVAFRGRRAHA